MILLRPDCLVFETDGGEQVPCSAEQVTIELLGAAAEYVDATVIENAAQGVLHYFKSDLGKTTVSKAEFAAALERALRGLGLDAEVADVTGEGGAAAWAGADADLRQLACESGKAFELAFFARLREELRRQLGCAPRVARFRGLRGCVKQLAGARRWCPRCQGLNDQIVDYLRTCLGAEAGPAPRALVVE
jgi:hypothetical protein